MYHELAQILREKNKITVLTGAGISTASGIPDFRSQGGLYDTHLNVEAILSETYFRANPESFWKYYKNIFLLSSLPNFQPNLGHLFLKHLEDIGKEVVIITQNVDDLHRKAGSSTVFEVHGTLSKAHCPLCQRSYNLEHLLQSEIPRCEEDEAILKPDVVLFEGIVKHMEQAYAHVSESEVFMALGTSLQVYPVKELPNAIRGANHIYKVLINKEPTVMDEVFDFVFHEDITAVFEQVKAGIQ